MTKFVLFSDLHIHRWSEFANGDDRLNDCISVLTDIRMYCVSNKIHDVVFGGDMFHTRGVVKTRSYAKVANEMLAFKDAGISFFASVGNHDQEDAAGDVHALQPLMAGGLIRGVGKRGYRTIKIGDADVTLFSYCDSADTLHKRIRKSREGAASDRLLCAVFHHGFKGAKVGSTLEYVVKEPIDAKELKLDKLYDLVFSGHYHTRQRIVGCDRGWYIGSPLEHTRSDRTEVAKGFLVVDTSDMTFKRVPLKRPRFVTLDVGDSVATAEGNFVDVVYKRADESLETYLAEVRAAGARGVNPVPLPKAKSTAKRRLNVSPTLAPHKVLQRYLKHRRKETKRQGLKSAELMKLGLELISNYE